MTSLVATAHEEFAPTTAAELARFVAENAGGARKALYPAGGRTALHFGYPPPRAGVTVSTARLGQIVDYPARDMTVTAQVGVRVEQLAESLRAERQQLPIDVPQSSRATLGGIIASNVSGPRRLGYGTLRDYVIGISAVDGQGRLFSAGGRVVKNVAGYDLCKLLVGSLGTLGIVTQVTLKLRPIAETSALVWTTFDSFAEIEGVLGRLLKSEARPVLLEVLSTEAALQIGNEARRPVPMGRPVLVVGVEGTEREVDWQSDRLRREIAPYGADAMEVLRGEVAEALLPAFVEFCISPDAPLTFKANLLPSRTMDFAAEAVRRGVSLQAHAGNGIVVGHLPDDASTFEKAETIVSALRGRASEHRGNLTILHCPPEWKERLPLFGERENAWPLMCKLKEALDPHGLLNPGRFFDRTFN